MIVPPHDLTLREVDGAGMEVSERRIERTLHITHHPCAGSLRLRIEVVHRGSGTDEECLSLVDGDDRYGIFRHSSIVGHGIGDRL